MANGPTLKRPHIGLCYIRIADNRRGVGDQRRIVYGGATRARDPARCLPRGLTRRRASRRPPAVTLPGTPARMRHSPRRSIRRPRAPDRRCSWSGIPFVMDRGESHTTRPGAKASEIGCQERTGIVWNQETKVAYRMVAGCRASSSRFRSSATSCARRTGSSTARRPGRTSGAGSGNTAEATRGVEGTTVTTTRIRRCLLALASRMSSRRQETHAPCKGTRHAQRSN